MTKPLEEPPEWEGDDSVNTPEGLKKITEDDLEDADELEEEDAEADDDA